MNDAHPQPELPRPEYPRPQFVRPDWLNLNGRWEFEVDGADTGLERGLRDRTLSGEILVPFAPESTASGVGETDFLEAVWYRRTVVIPTGWAGRRTLLHFGAVDYDTTVWVDGVEVGRHRGGFTSFAFDITDAVIPGSEAVLVVRARDHQGGPQARGKQATRYANSGCHYTRTTGIWQTVWLEPVATDRLMSVVTTPVLADHRFEVAITVAGRIGGVIEAVLSDAEGTVAVGSAPVGLDFTPQLSLVVADDRVRPWSPSDPHLYDLRLRLSQDGEVVDEVTSYAGLRSVAISGRQVLINGEAIFQRLVLDQGYWPDTLMTAPSDAELIADIERAMAAGFNGARLHQKVFEERYLYHADRLGYLVWGEFADWGCAEQGGRRDDHQRPTTAYVAEWLEVLRRDRNHPAIIGWCPLNETYQQLGDRTTALDDTTQAMFWATKLADPTRPVIDASGYAHRVVETDVYDAHHYEQDPDRFAADVVGEERLVNDLDGVAMSVAYRGQPYLISEFGGIWWNPEQAATGPDEDRTTSWGYGQRVDDLEAFYTRFAGLIDVLLDEPGMFGYCYTQLTDVFQEENGLFTFDRAPKFDLARLRAIQQRPAAYEVPRVPAAAPARNGGGAGDGPP